jgi:hypothetical protein
MARNAGVVFVRRQPGAGLIGLPGRAWVHDDLSVGSAAELSPSPRAEEVGFEPTVGCPTHDFQSCRFGRSRTPPELQPGQANGSDRSRPADRPVTLSIRRRTRLYPCMRPHVRLREPTLNWACVDQDGLVQRRNPRTQREAERPRRGDLRCSSGFSWPWTAQTLPAPRSCS